MTCGILFGNGLNIVVSCGEIADHTMIIGQFFPGEIF